MTKTYHCSLCAADSIEAPDDAGRCTSCVERSARFRAKRDAVLASRRTDRSQLGFSHDEVGAIIEKIARDLGLKVIGLGEAITDDRYGAEGPT